MSAAKILAPAGYAGNMLFVDAIYGGNTTAAVGRSDLPYLTLAAAKAAASSGDTEVIRPDTWAGDDLLKTGVDMLFLPGASVNDISPAKQGLFTDEDGPVTATIVGGSFDFDLNTSGTNATIYMEDSGSNLAFLQLERLDNSTTVSGGAQGYTIAALNGFIKVDSADIVGNNVAALLNWYQGDMKTRSFKMSLETDNTLLYAVCPTAAPTGKVWMDTLEADSTGSLAVIIPEAAAQLTTQVWFRALEARSRSTTQPAIYAEDGRNYFTTQKISSSGSQYILQQVTSGITWLETLKSAGLVADIDGGTAHIQTLDWEDNTGSTTFFIDVSGGTLVIYGGRFVGATSNGLRITGGTVILINCILDFSGVVGSNPVTKTGGTLKMYNSTLIARSGRDSIEATGAQNVMAVGCATNNAVDANVTITVPGGLLVDSNVS